MSEDQENQLRQEVLQTEQAWTDAHTSLDNTAIEGLMADDYHKIDINGKVLNKAEVMDSYRTQGRY